MREPAPGHTVPANRQTGRTTAMIEAAKAAHEQGVRVIVVGHNHEYARLLAQRIGCQEFSGIDTIGERLRGSNAVPFVDHHAVERWSSAIFDAHVRAKDAAKSRDQAWADNDRLRHELDDARQSLVSMRERWNAAAVDAEKWRARCPVTAADVEAAGVTAEQCEAFLLANGGYHVERFCVLAPNGWQWMEGSADFCIAEACNRYARSSGTPAQDVLVAMQRTEVG